MIFRSILTKNMDQTIEMFKVRTLSLLKRNILRNKKVVNSLSDMLIGNLNDSFVFLLTVIAIEPICKEIVIIIRVTVSSMVGFMQFKASF